MTVDDDGIGPSFNDPYHQGDTNLHAQVGGKSSALDATKVNWFVLQTGWAKAHGNIQLGDIASITYNNRHEYAVFGDNNGTGSSQHGEGSVHLVLALGGPKQSPQSSLNTPPDVQYTIYPQSHKLLKIPDNDGTFASAPIALDQLQDQINQYGKQLSGGGLPTSSPESVTQEPSCACQTSSASALPGSSNAQKAFNFFTSPPHNLSPAAAAGLVGNFQQESGASLDTHADNGSHFGIAQWSSTRWSDLQAHEKGKNIYDLAVQLDFVWYELTHGYSSVLQGIKQSSSPEGAAQIVFNDYEVAGDDTLPKRQANARNIYNLYGNSAPSGTGASTSTSTASVSSADCSQGSSAASPPNFIDLSGPSTAAMSRGKLKNINAIGIHYTEGNTEGLPLATQILIPASNGIQFNIGLTGKVYEFFPLNNMQETWNIGDINDHEIGIEITGMDGEALLNNQTQFNSVVNTVKYLCGYYHIPCDNPKGNITGTTDPAQAQGILGHDEAPNGDNPDAQHSDPDTKIVNGVQYDITTGKVWNYATDSKNSSIHAYMMKLRQALGYNPTPH